MDDNQLKEIFDTLQEENNKLFNELGATDEVIDLQISINKLRNKFNIPDNSEMTKSNIGFVQ